MFYKIIRIGNLAALIAPIVWLLNIILIALNKYSIVKFSFNAISENSFL